MVISVSKSGLCWDLSSVWMHSDGDLESSHTSRHERGKITDLSSFQRNSLTGKALCNSLPTTFYFSLIKRAHSHYDLLQSTYVCVYTHTKL